MESGREGKGMGTWCVFWSDGRAKFLFFEDSTTCSIISMSMSVTVFAQYHLDNACWRGGDFVHQMSFFVETPARIC